MTPRETALRMMRQRGTTVSHPDFIVAYLRAELELDSEAFHTPIQKTWNRVRRTFTEFADALRQMGVAVEKQSDYTVAR